MIAEDLMRKYKYGYIHSCKLLEEPFIKTLLKENKELKKQLEERSKDYCNASDIKHNYAKKLVIIQNQQQEFIKYLEDEIKKIQEQIKNYDIWHEVGTDINFLILKKQFNIEILLKYKEIIGEDK